MAGRKTKRVRVGNMAKFLNLQYLSFQFFPSSALTPQFWKMASQVQERQYALASRIEVCGNSSSQISQQFDWPQWQQR